MNAQGKYAIAGIVGLIIGLGLWRVLPSDAAKTELDWKFNGQSLKLNVAKDLRDPEAMFKKLFGTEFSRAGALALLRRQNIFSMEDSSFLDALRNYCPNEVAQPESPEQHQKRLRKCFEFGVLRQLRQMAVDHSPPFQYIGTEVRVGTPERDQPPDLHANVCASGGLLGHRIEIDNPALKTTVIVQATGYYDCTGFSDFPDIQLNAHDASTLFGRPTRKYENAIAVVLGS